jgi:hypothetical protein
MAMGTTADMALRSFGRVGSLRMTERGRHDGRGRGYEVRGDELVWNIFII